MPYAGYTVGIYVSQQPSLTLTDEAMTNSGDDKTFNVTDRAKQCFDIQTAWDIQTSPDGASWSTVTTGFTIHYAIGRIVFKTAIAGSTPSVRVHAGKYLVTAFLGFAHEMSINVGGAILDDTAYTNPPSPWKTFQPGLRDASVKLAHWWVDERFLTYMTDARWLVLELYPNQSINNRFQGYSLLQTSSLKMPVNALKDEDLQLQISGQLYYLTGA